MKLTSESVSLVENSLYINGAHPDPEILTAQELHRALIVGRQAIVSGITEFYEKIKTRYPDNTVQRASVHIFGLGAETKDGLTSVSESAYMKNTGIFSNIEEIAPRWHDYWLAIEDADFIPEARRWTGDRIGLLLRDAPYE